MAPDILPRLMLLKLKFDALPKEDQELYLGQLEAVYLDDSELGHEIAEVLRNE